MVAMFVSEYHPDLIKFLITKFLQSSPWPRTEAGQYFFEPAQDYKGIGTEILGQQHYNKPKSSYILYQSICSKVVCNDSEPIHTVAANRGGFYLVFSPISCNISQAAILLLQVLYAYRLCAHKTELMLHQRTNRQYPQFGILSPIGDLKSPIGDNIPNWGLGIYESSNAESENKSPIPNWLKYNQAIGDLK